MSFANMPVRYAYSTVGRYRATYACKCVDYGLRVNDNGTNGDPYFVIRVGAAFCNEDADVFTRAKGRSLAMKKMDSEDSFFIVTVFINQPIRTAIEREIGRMVTKLALRIGVPSSIVNYFHSLHSRKVVKTKYTEVQLANRRSKSMFSRLMYNECCNEGMTCEKAIQYVKEHIGP